MTTRTTRSMSRQLEQLGTMPYAKKLESMEIDEVATVVSYLLAQTKMKLFLRFVQAHSTWRILFPSILPMWTRMRRPNTVAITWLIWRIWISSRKPRVAPNYLPSVESKDHGAQFCLIGCMILCTSVNL